MNSTISQELLVNLTFTRIAPMLLAGSGVSPVLILVYADAGQARRLSYDRSRHEH